MNIEIKTVYILLLFLLCSFSSSSQIEEAKFREPASDLELKKRVTQKLSFLVGEWESFTWFYVDGKRPNNPDIGSYKAYFTLNNAFVADEIVSTNQGKNYLGRSFHTFNTQTKYYETWYFDSDGLVVRYPNGYWEDEKNLVFIGKDIHDSGIKEKRTYFTILSQDAFSLIEKQDYDDGKGLVTVLEVKYRRIKK